MMDNSYSRDRESKNKLIWIILGIVLIIGLICGIYFFIKSNNSSNQPSQNPNNPLPGNIKYLPSEEEVQAKINQIKSAKNLDDQQATIEFLTQYVPHIKWWEINSLQELDEKIKLVNNQTGFPPFKEVPEVDKFNKEVEGNMQKKAQIFLTSIIPRQADNTPDWKGIKDFQNYMLTIMKPIMEGIKFKPAFATQENYQELARRLKEEVNPNLVSTCSRFASLNNVSALNQLTNEYLSKIFQGYIYAEAIHDELGQQLNLTNHQKFKFEGTGNHSENEGWNIALNEFGFKGNSPEPQPNPQEEDFSNSTWQDIVNDLKVIEDEINRLIPITESNQPGPPGSPYYEKWQNELQGYKLGKQEINSFRTMYPSPITDKQEIAKHRTYFRKKWNWFFRNN